MTKGPILKIKTVKWRMAFNWHSLRETGVKHRAEGLCAALDPAPQEIRPCDCRKKEGRKSESEHNVLDSAMWNKVSDNQK